MSLLYGMRSRGPLKYRKAFLVFDHLITLAQEVDLFWKPKLSGAGVIFLLNRYIVLITMLLNVSGVIFTVPAQVRFLHEFVNIV